MIGFRNILVHDNLKIDRSIVFRVLQENIDDLETLDFINVYFDFQHTFCVSIAFGSCVARNTFP
jgi:hypothetical protein